MLNQTYQSYLNMAKLCPWLYDEVEKEWKLPVLTPSHWKVRELVLSDLEKFISLVAPYRVLGDVHKEAIRWMTREGSKSHQILLLPRDHGKSALVGYRVAWDILRNPHFRYLYLSSTSGLAEKQLKFIKDVLESDAVRKYFPEYIHQDISKRERWSQSEIIIDHPMRKLEGIRDSTVFTAGLTTSVTGFHCDVTIFDDVVVMENAYTEDGRHKVKQQYSLLASVESGEARQWVVGTRYHPKDLYQELLDMRTEIFDDEGNVTGQEQIYEVFERKVEDRGDGTGTFLWPRQQREDGKWFGFNAAILARKKAQYLDKTQFYAQYYNTPNDPDAQGITRDKFQYYDSSLLTKVGQEWYYRNRRLNLFAAIDFAYSTGRKSDYTVLIVVGVDYENNVFVLDGVRIKTDKISDYFKIILDMKQKWDFKKLRAEVSVGQKAIVRELKLNYLQPNGLFINIDEYLPTRNNGTKEERMASILQPRYENQKIFHFQGGFCNYLEEEVLMAHPPHDDCKDALASAIDISVAPINATRQRLTNKNNVVYHSRFGGVSYK